MNYDREDDEHSYPTGFNAKMYDLGEEQEFFPKLAQ